MAFFILGILLGIIGYILQSAGLFILAERRGIRLPGLAWVPIGNGWILASLADQYMDVTQQRKTKYRYFFVIFLVGVILLEIFGLRRKSTLATFIMIIAAVVVLILWYTILYYFFKSCVREGSRTFFLCTYIFPALQPILIFTLRNYDEGMIPVTPNPEEESYRRDYYEGGFFR